MELFLSSIKEVESMRSFNFLTVVLVVAVRETDSCVWLNMDSPKIFMYNFCFILDSSMRSGCCRFFFVNVFFDP